MRPVHSIIPVHSSCASKASMADAPPPCDESEEEQHNAWNQLLELFTFQCNSPEKQQCLTEEKLCKTALTCHFASDVIYMPMEWRPKEDQTLGKRNTQQARFSAATKGEAGGSVGCRAQLLLRPRLGVDGRQSNRNVHEGRRESGWARLEQLVNRAERHAEGCRPHAAASAKNSRVSPASPSPNPSLAAFAARSAASWRHHDGASPRCCASDRVGTLHA